MKTSSGISYLHFSRSFTEHLSLCYDYRQNGLVCIFQEKMTQKQGQVGACYVLCGEKFEGSDWTICCHKHYRVKRKIMTKKIPFFVEGCSLVAQALSKKLSTLCFTFFKKIECPSEPELPNVIMKVIQF